MRIPTALIRNLGITVLGGVATFLSIESLKRVKGKFDNWRRVTTQPKLQPTGKRRNRS